MYSCYKCGGTISINESFTIDIEHNKICQMCVSKQDYHEMETHGEIVLEFDGKYFHNGTEYLKFEALYDNGLYFKNNEKIWNTAKMFNSQLYYCQLKV